MIPIYKPYLTPSMLKYAHDALDSTWISSQGEYIAKAIELLKNILGIDHVLLTNNGTTAGHLMAKCLHKAYPTVTEIIAPNNVYIAAYNTLLYDKKFMLHILDTDPNTYNFNTQEARLSTYYKNIAILVVHNLGNIVNIPKLTRELPIKVPIIEDNCEGLFGKHEGSYSGTASLCSCVSFFGNKTVTSGEGGAFITNNKDLYDYAKLLHGQGMSEIRYIHNELGYNYRMTNVEAAILYGQLLRKNDILDMKQFVFNRYKNNLANIENISFQKEEPDTNSANWLFSVRFKNNSSYKLAKDYFDTYGIETRPLFYPAKMHKHLLNGPVTFGADYWANKLNQQVVIFPSYPELSPEDIDYISERIKWFSIL